VLKTSSGKVRRSACRELYEQGLLGKQHTALWWQLSRIMFSSAVPLMRRVKNSLRSRLWTGFAKAVFYTLAPIAWLLVVSLPVTDWRWGIMRGATRLLSLLTGCPLRVEGSQHLLPPGQACVYVANHASYLDGPLLIAALKRPFSFVAKAELARQGIAGSFLRAIDTEFVERFDARQGVSDAQRITLSASQGRSLLFFPEGTFTRTPGLLPFRMGAFLTAAEAGLPVIPVAIRGSRSILRGDSKRPHKGSVTITIGESISGRDVGGEEHTDNWFVALALRDAARAHILRHCGEPDLAGQTDERAE
jgi:1-acyl-sn-glycerol-3-phosphate acyltransferase